jgi:phenylacetic acid degradation operon negative regulatory protein
MTIRELILEKLSEIGEGMLNAFFPANYPQARIWRSLLGLGNSYKFSRKNFSRTLSGLSGDGLVRRIGSKQKAVWQITEEGKELLRKNLIKTDNAKEDGKTRLVVFDVPESERRKRRWLRGRLMELGYRPAQRSVWFGKTPLPTQFMKDLKEFKLWQHILIFEVSKEIRPTED